MTSELHPVDEHQPIPHGIDKPIVLVGMMGSGKSSVGKRLAARLGLVFMTRMTRLKRQQA
jgi:hypothetical protein